MLSMIYVHEIRPPWYAACKVTLRVNQEDPVALCYMNYTRGLIAINFHFFVNHSKMYRKAEDT